MINYEQFINGLVNYIDNEIIPQINGIKRIAFSVGSSIILKKGNQMFDDFKNNKIIHSLDILDKDNNINIDMLRDEIKDKINEGGETINIPMIGNLKINKEDINLIYRYMKGE